MPNQICITAQNVLEPWVIRTIREAFEEAIKAVQEHRGPDAPPPSDGIRAKRAKQIVSMARTGECSTNRLRDGALNALQLGDAARG